MIKFTCYFLFGGIFELKFYWQRFDPYDNVVPI